MKAYSAKSSAIRAAKKVYGGEWESKANVQANEDGGWVIIENKPKPAPKMATSGDALANKLSLGWKLSTTEKPTKKVWSIAESMPGASRKEVVQACIDAGIGAGTARTQYQAWFSAMKSSGLNPRG